MEVGVHQRCVHEVSAAEVHPAQVVPRQVTVRKVGILKHVVATKCRGVTCTRDGADGAAVDNLAGRRNANTPACSVAGAHLIASATHFADESDGEQTAKAGVAGLLTIANVAVITLHWCAGDATDLRIARLSAVTGISVVTNQLNTGCAGAPRAHLDAVAGVSIVAVRSCRAARRGSAIRAVTGNRHCLVRQRRCHHHDGLGLRFRSRYPYPGDEEQASERERKRLPVAPHITLSSQLDSTPPRASRSGPPLREQVASNHQRRTLG